MIRHAPSIGIGIGLSLRSQGAAGAAFSGLLDQYGGAAAAYSLRALSSGWAAGDVVRARRVNTPQEANFTASQVANGELATWALSGDAFVATWYDQSGNANNAVQTTTTAQPKIVSAGTLVVGGLDFDGVDDGLKTASALTNALTEAAAFIVSKNDVSTGQQSMIRIRPNAAIGVIDGMMWEQGSPTATKRYGGNTLIEGGGNAVGADSGGVGVQDTNEHLVSLLFQQSQMLAYEDSALDQTMNTVRSGAIPVGSVTLASPLWIGLNFDSGDRGFNGKMSELIIYFDDQSANRVGIETNINAAYSIYA